MNFILKNIGWIALFIFFAIMLLIISANQKDNLVSNKALQNAKNELILTGSQVMESGSGVLTDLVKMLDEEEASETNVEVEDIEINKIQEVKEVQVEMKEEEKEKDSKKIDAGVIGLDSNENNLTDEDKQGVIQSFFSKFKKDKQEETIEENIDTEQTTTELTEKPEADLIVTKKANTKEAPVKTVYKNIAYKDGTFRDIPSYDGQFTMNQKPLPGVNLKTAIGNTYKLGVAGLKLNNAYFNQSLGIMKKGDVVKQLTTENRYGCFKVEVTSGNIQGKEGYVCKKWFTKNTTPVQHMVTTAIGDVHIVNTLQLKLNNKAFNTALAVMDKGDRLEQIGNENNYGCFQARILTSDIANNIGLVGYVCKKYLVSPDSENVSISETITALQSYALTRETKVGDTHRVSAHSLKLNNISFNKNLGYLAYDDTLKQLTEENKHGCFSVEVMQSRNTSSTGKVGYVCKKYLK